MKSIILSLLLAAIIPVLSWGQMKKILHQAFEHDSANIVSLDFHWQHQIVPWEGNVLLTETEVNLFDASPAILNYLIDSEKRYAILASHSSDTLKLKSFEKKREHIQTRNGVCSEIVIVKVYVPKFYAYDGENSKMLLKKRERY
jgi:hypothetical protein